MKKTDQNPNEDRAIDLTLRPEHWDDYVGQEKIKDSLKVILAAAKKEKRGFGPSLIFRSRGTREDDLGLSCRARTRRHDQDDIGAGLGKIRRSRGGAYQSFAGRNLIYR